jgi:hypothetical protein
MVIPLSSGYLNMRQIQMYWAGEDTNAIVWLAASAEAAVQFLYIIMGSLMIYCLICLSRALKKLPSSERMNIKALLVHSGAFFLFTIGAIAWSIMFYFYMFPGDRPYVERNMLIVDLAYDWLQFASECCICVVIWNLANKD